jgi:hypothetical protein
MRRKSVTAAGKTKVQVQSFAVVSSERWQWWMVKWFHSTLCSCGEKKRAEGGIGVKGQSGRCSSSRAHAHVASTMSSIVASVRYRQVARVSEAAMEGAE